MDEDFVNISFENMDEEHLCCAMADKKHQCGVQMKKAWLKEQIPEGHIFRKLGVKGKVFIEYAPLEKAWVPIHGANYLYIYCLWVAGAFKGKGYAKSLLEYCIEDGKKQGNAGICILSSPKKKPYLAEEKFLLHNGFQVVDSIGEYELLALSFDGTKPYFAENAKRGTIDRDTLTIYFARQCPFIPNCVEQIKNYCGSNGISVEFIEVDSLEKAKSVPCVFNNWAVFLNRKFVSVQLLNEGGLKKILER
ncbi:GNAT family N-acetyltransferase [Anaerotignum sp.]|uniref:GNAT family N-acetyltransferase n=1 Tax=Anaerotignum sp. TaxID=2039241 RepID=UPI00331F45A1